MAQGFGLATAYSSTDVVHVVSPTSGTSVSLRPDQKVVAINAPASSTGILYLPPPESMPGEVVVLNVVVAGGGAVNVLYYEGEDGTINPVVSATGLSGTDDLTAQDDYMVLVSTGGLWVILAERTT